MRSCLPALETRASAIKVMSTPPRAWVSCSSNPGSQGTACNQTTAQGPLTWLDSINE
jgi:hypothetical protein